MEATWFGARAGTGKLAARRSPLMFFAGTGGLMTLSDDRYSAPCEAAVGPSPWFVTVTMTVPEAPGERWAGGWTCVAIRSGWTAPRSLATWITQGGEEVPYCCER